MIDDDPERHLMVGERALRIVIRDGDMDYPCGRVFEGDKLLIAISPFVSAQAPDWLMAEAVAEALEQQQRFEAEQAR